MSRIIFLQNFVYPDSWDDLFDCPLLWLRIGYYQHVDDEKNHCLIVRITSLDVFFSHLSQKFFLGHSGP